MDLNVVTLAAALAAGLLSFASPCVVPLVPAYLSYITGLSIEQLSDNQSQAQHRQIVTSSLAFVIGLALIFTLLGASASLIGQVLTEYQPVIIQLAGILIIVFGLQMLGILKLDFLYREKRFDFVRWRKSYGYLGSVAMGAAFGVGWTPCVGSFLSAIFALAAQSNTVYQGMLLLFVYAMGLGIPFIVTAVVVNRLTTGLNRIKRHMRTLTMASGLLLIAMGILVFTNQLALISAWFIRVFGFGLAL